MADIQKSSNKALQPIEEEYKRFLEELARLQQEQNAVLVDYRHRLELAKIEELRRQHDGA